MYSIQFMASKKGTKRRSSRSSRSSRSTKSTKSTKSTSKNRRQVYSALVKVNKLSRSLSKAKRSLRRAKDSFKKAKRSVKRSRSRSAKRSRSRSLHFRSRPGRKTRNVSKSSCLAQSTKKYMTRGSPPFPANMLGCRGTIKQGNDGHNYISSMNMNGIYTWKRTSKPMH